MWNAVDCPGRGSKLLGFPTANMKISRSLSWSVSGLDPFQVMSFREAEFVGDRPGRLFLDSTLSTLSTCYFTFSGAVLTCPCRIFDND